MARGAVRAGVLPLPRLLSPAGPTPRRWLAFVASLVMSFLLGFFLEATLGMIGFWFLEVSSLLFVYMLFNFFFSGHMFPIDMLPGVWGTDRQADAAAIPGLFSGGRVPGQDHRARSWSGALASQFAWVVFFIVAQPRGVPPRRAALQRVSEDEATDERRLAIACLLPRACSPSPATASCAT